MPTTTKTSSIWQKVEIEEIKLQKKGYYLQKGKVLSVL